MAVNSGNGWLKFSLGTQVLKWMGLITDSTTGA